ncbi:type II toxin-antitoxin system RelB/DinJ family antitoxin [candidate division KSB1 bacterium]|nr:type II toxin-antitoxin system RelB/DinJ family antitoxin [candidate division KSB1 bacterium]
MPKNTTVRAIMDPDKKEHVSKILKRLGINHSDAINIFYSLIKEYNGLPFELKLPDTEQKDVSSRTIRPEVISYLKESLKRNRRLGELLAK